MTASSTIGEAVLHHQLSRYVEQMATIWLTLDPSPMPEATQDAFVHASPWILIGMTILFGTVLSAIYIGLIRRTGRPDMRAFLEPE